MEKIRIGIVNYLNTKPLLYGIERTSFQVPVELVPDYPSRIAEQLLSNRIDLGLVPVVVIPELKEAHIVSDYCIGCHGPVASVGIFSDVPLEEAETVLLDYQSRTSVALARVLLREYWKLGPHLEDGGEGFSEHIRDRVAGLLIGDRALKQRKRSRFEYDLGEAWKEFTGLPFVFAAWVSNKPLDPGFLETFNVANAIGLSNLSEIVRANPVPYFDLLDYYTRYIDYQLDEAKRKALALFLEMCRANGPGIAVR